MSIEWSPGLTSGIETIDLQHIQIIELLNQLPSTSQKSSCNSDELVSCLIELSKVIQEHFDYEEVFLAEAGYKGLKHHKAGHDEISEILNSITMAVLLDATDIPYDSIARVVNWLEEHIRSEDVKYFTAIQESENTDLLS